MDKKVKRIIELSPEKLAQLLDKRGRKADKSIRPRDHKNSPVSLSFAQERLWFLHQLKLGGAFYNSPTNIRLTGALNTETLERCLNEIIRRHESLRTTFSMLDGEPVQVVADSMVLPMPIVELQDLAPEGRKAEFLRLASEEAHKRFDLAQGPLVRVLLLRLSKTEHVLLLNFHHIVIDGWSLGVFFRELTAYYDSLIKGKSASLPELPIQYPDFSLWQRQRIGEEIICTQLAYWKERLAGLHELNLPTDRQRPAMPTFRGGRESLLLPKELGEVLLNLSKKEEVTLFMTLLTAFSVLLYRYTGQEDIVVGSPIANRNISEIEGLIGFFVNMLVMRVNVSANPSFRDLLTAVREVTLGAYQHQDLPFEKLVKELEPERDLSSNPLFQVTFALQNAPMPSLRLGDLALHLDPAPLETVRFDLEVHVFEMLDNSLNLTFIYNTDLFNQSTIQRMLGHFHMLLQEVAVKPDVRISRFSLLNSAERQQIIHSWNKTGTDYPKNKCVHELFEEQVRKNPDALALEFDQKTMSYRELNEQANQLAHFLQKTGAGPEIKVGIILDRSLEMVVAILGTLKAGAAYVPLDPSYPRQRLAFMLQDASAPILLTQDVLAKKVPVFSGTIVRLDTDWKRIAREPRDKPHASASTDNLAYVIYTSGSTGLPKGVEVTRRSLLNLVSWHHRTYSVTQSDRATLLAGIGFDASVWEHWSYITAGASLFVPDNTILYSPEKLLSWLLEKRITMAFLVTPLVEIVLQDPRIYDLGLRYLFTGGEQLRKRPDSTLPFDFVNLYGPSESTVVSTWAKIKAKSAVESPPPIGKPIDNVQTYILDSTFQLVPVGVYGELYIGGHGLARGYLNRPELTAERFMPNPFSKEPGERLYRTGDRVRYLEDGTIEFFDRLDNQVKIRGFRIELGEIESMLGRHPAVREAVVLAREDKGWEKRLVAYVVPDTAGSAAENKATGRELHSEQVCRWERIFDDYIYGQTPSEQDLTFNIIGWNSSYTGQPIAAEEMRIWVQDTVDRIRAFNPRRVLEIGCGTGLLLFRIAPGCDQYRGTDFSKTALDYIKQQQELDPDLSRVALFNREANDFEDIDADAFDAVIINSVIQYFPDIDYLLQVLEGAVKATAPGGIVFIGDVRSLPLLESFHTSVQLFQAESSLPVDELLRQIQGQMAAETELAIDPAFFIALKHQLPKVAYVEIKPKQGRADNELTRFRYQVVLHVGPQEDPPQEISWLDWRQEGFSLETVDRILTETSPETLCIKDVLNARVSTSVRMVKLLQDSEESATAGELRAMDQYRLQDGVHPEDIWALGHESDYQVEISWANHDCQGRYDVVFVKRSTAGIDRATRICAFPGETRDVKQWSSYANNPSQGDVFRKLIPQLRGFLSEKLPDYMVPAAFVSLDALPLTPNGKIDRKALPFPGQENMAPGETYVAPRNGIEEDLARIWAEVLHLEQIGIHDNFFELGGHSLNATQVVSRIRESFGVELPLMQLFAGPTLAEIAEQIETIRAGNKESLESLPILPRDRSERLPLSFAQQRLWFLDQLEPDNPSYNMPFALSLCGSLDIQALGESFTEIIRRHEVLRTTFVVDQGQPVQMIAKKMRIMLSVEDLPHLPENEKKNLVGKKIKEESILPFDLAQGPLLRVNLFRLNDNEYILVLVMHHIISDGWSIDIFFRELATIYQAFSRGEPSPLLELPIQYADFTLWQREWLKGPILENELAYWQEQLNDLPTLDLPTDRQRSPLQSYGGKWESVVVSGVFFETLKEFCMNEDVTMFMTIFTVFKVLLLRWTGQEDIVVGSPIAARNRHEIENVIGFFINTLVMRTNLSGNPTFRQSLHRVRDTALEAYTHQDLPFEKLVEELQPDRDMSRNPLFQVFFNYVNIEGTQFSLPPLEVEPVKIGFEFVKFDINLNVFEDGDRLTLCFGYNAHLYNAETIRQLINYLKTLLGSAMAEPDQQISRLRLLSDREREALAGKRNRIVPLRPPVAFPAKAIEQTIPVRFAKQVHAGPERIAVLTARTRWTYAQLDHISDQIGTALLRCHGAGEQRIALLLDHGAPMIASLLGVLKAGKAYVPLNPFDPPKRLTAILADAEVSGLLIEAKYASLGASLERAATNILFLEDCLANPPEIPEVQRSSDSIAYLLYTSGSTGLPKGVVQNDRNVLHHIRAYTRSLRLNNDDRLTLLSSYTFDAAVMGIFGALLNGATLCPYDLRSDGFDQLAAWINHCGITVYHSTPTVFRHFSGQLEGNDSLPSVRYVVLGGEEVHHRDVEVFQRHFSSLCYFINGLGPTESTMSLQYWIDHETIFHDKAVPVGYPVVDTEVQLLDKDGEPTDLYGEIAIKSRHVALEYWRQLELTEDRFIGYEDGSRLYRTGDMGRQRADGSLVFAGRKDQQVKLRGMRVEPGEIEAVLLQHEQVEQAAVAVQEDEQGKTRLVAYIVAAHNNSPDPRLLREHLKGSLPVFMVPSAIIPLDALPMTTGGKVNRTLLPRPIFDELLQTEFVPPATEAEKQITRIWQEVLERQEPVGIHDDFFELGGHSLSATQVISRLQEVFQVKLPVITFFERPTIHELAALMTDLVNKEKSGSVAIQTISPEPDTSQDSSLDALSDDQVSSMLKELMGQEEQTQ